MGANKRAKKIYGGCGTSTELPLDILDVSQDYTSPSS